MKFKVGEKAMIKLPVFNGSMELQEYVSTIVEIIEIDEHCEHKLCYKVKNNSTRTWVREDILNKID